MRCLLVLQRFVRDRAARRAADDAIATLPAAVVEGDLETALVRLGADLLGGGPREPPPTTARSSDPTTERPFSHSVEICTDPPKPLY